jgi:hypothetical protein
MLPNCICCRAPNHFYRKHNVIFLRGCMQISCSEHEQKIRAQLELCNRIILCDRDGVSKAYMHHTLLRRSICHYSGQEPLKQPKCNHAIKRAGARKMLCVSSACVYPGKELSQQLSWLCKLCSYMTPFNVECFTSYTWFAGMQRTVFMVTWAALR